jgi:hypothetical protein
MRSCRGAWVARGTSYRIVNPYTQLVGVTVVVRTLAPVTNSDQQGGVDVWTGAGAK